MPKGKDFINEILRKAGVQDENLTVLTEAIADVEISDEVSTTFYNSFFTKDTAITNDDIRKKIGNDAKAQVLNQFDSIYLKRATEFGLTDADIEAIKAERSTFEKEKKFQDAVRAKMNKDKSTSLKDVQAQLDATQAQLRDKEKAEENLKQSLEAEKHAFYKQANLDLHFQSHTDWKGSAFEGQKNKHLLAEANFQELLNKYDAEAHFDINEKKFIIAKKGSPDVKVYDSKHAEMTFETFSTLAMEEFKPKKPADGGGNPNPPYDPPKKPGANGGGTRNTYSDQFSKVKSI